MQSVLQINIWVCLILFVHEDYSKLLALLDLKIPFLHINHLIANKKAVNRPKDQLDVIYLEKIKQIRAEEGL